MVSAKIASVRLTRVAIPLNMVYASSMYIIRKTERTVVELTAESGATGIGETWGTPEVFALTVKLARDWIGRDALDRFALRRAFGRNSFENRSGRNGWAAFAGMDLAAWDAAARTLGLPLAGLIEPRPGGAERHGARTERDGAINPATRASVEVVTPLPAAIVDSAVPRAKLQAHMDDLGNAKKVVDFALEQRNRHGFGCFKYKSAAWSPQWDWTVLSLLREALPDARIRFDPNAAYAPATAIELCRRLDALKLEFFEDPTGELEGIARLRASVKTPVATNMWVVQDAQLAPAIRRQAVDVLLADIFMWGGLDAWRRMARVAPQFGMQPALHSIFETGIATVANLHIAAALPQVRHANDSGLHFLADDVLATAPAIVGGRMTLPEGPGLGVSVDRGRLERLAIETKDIQ
jgi:glucarate dehydratase